MAVRDHILEAAYDLLVRHSDQPFSHEAVAARAGVGARTVYRYFPAQVNLYEELWVRIRREAGTIFPTREEEILPQVPVLFEGFNRNEDLVKAVLESRAGEHVRQRGAPEGRASFAKSLAALTAGMTAAEKRRVVAVFLAIYSAPFWHLLRERGALPGPDALCAAKWAMEALMRDLRTRKGVRPPQKKKGASQNENSRAENPRVRAAGARGTNQPASGRAGRADAGKDRGQQR